jgi:hypothetical protein
LTSTYKIVDSETLKINPGVNVLIGKKISRISNLFVFVKKYAEEWQFWYQAAIKLNSSEETADLAAAIVMARYYEILPYEEKLKINVYLSKKINFLLEFFQSKKSIKELIDIDITYLQRFRTGRKYSGSLDLKTLEVIFLLGKPEEAFLIQGGDSRLDLNDGFINRYGSRPFPRPDIINFSSSTASNISVYAFHYIRKNKKALITSSFESSLAITYSEILENIKSRIRKYLKLTGRKMFLAPSGTDAILYLAGQLNNYNNGYVQHVLVGADETGSGVVQALEGKHFSNVTSQNKKVVSGEIIEGFKERVVLQVNLKYSNGKFKLESIINDEIELAITDSIRNGLIPVLHIINQSKLGFVSPSFNVISKLSTKFKNKIIFHIDNSQMRMNESDIQNHLKLPNCFMTITGSKFFTGPPFCGALVYPEAFKCFTNNIYFPVGLSDYLTDFEIKLNSGIEEQSNSEKYNLGLVFRWLAALTEIDSYQMVPLHLIKKGTEIFNKGVYKKITEAEFLNYFNNGECRSFDNTIHPFYILRENQPISFSDINIIFNLLNTDLTQHFFNNNLIDSRLAGTICHIGQPVIVGSCNGVERAVLRINMGSRVISSCWKDEDEINFFSQIEKQLNEIDIVIDKIKFILDNWSVLIR